MSARHDVAIAGGGAIGAALALALAKEGCEVALIEPQAPAAFDPSAPHDLRAYALSPASIALLERLGVWRDVVTRRVSPYATMKVWSDDMSRGIAFDAKLIGETKLGAIVEDRALRDALWQRVVASPRIVLHAAALERFEALRTHARLALAGGTSVDAALAVAADGARSTLRTLAGLDATASDPHQRAIVANVRTERPHEATAWQRFTEHGPLAFLPLSNGECSIVWSVPEAVATELLALDDAAFRARLGSAFQHRLGEIVESSKRLAFPLSSMNAPRYVGERVALVGDAAHVVLPLAGQGLNLGLLDAAALVEVLRDAPDRDAGAAEALERYERWRKPDNARAAQTFVALDRLFRAPTSAIAWIRGTGLVIADHIAPLKREIALQASGFGGRVPALSQRLA